uniref:FHF complex subunit HOOK-interacting protein C-terminal domain-containing protein n=1 Tax=Meloidogyne incognita TaxID=6306 RepID=A0A914NQR3_MELIC
MSKEPNPFRLNLEGESGGGEEVFLNISGGILMKSTEEKGAGILLESLFDILSNLTENSFNTNIQLLGVFNLLFSYPQPLLTAYLFYVDSLRGNLPLLKINDEGFCLGMTLVGTSNQSKRVPQFEIRRNRRSDMRRATLMRASLYPRY